MNQRVNPITDPTASLLTVCCTAAKADDGIGVGVGVSVVAVGVVVVGVGIVTKIG